MLILTDAYAGTIDPANTGFPGGKFKNETTAGDYSLSIDFVAQTYSLSYTGSADGTPVDADWGNNTEGAFQAILAEAGLTPNGAIEQVGASQILDAIKIIAQRYAVQTGDIFTHSGATAPTGSIKGNGGTIGSAASGATTRANADTEALFTLYWNDYDDASLPIQDSAGGASTRGASAAADFAANKRMTVPDLRAEFIRFLDDGRGVDPGRVLGSWQDHSYEAHTHPATGGQKSVLNDHNDGGSFSAGFTGGVSPGIMGTGTGNADTDTKPRNIALLGCIKL